MATSGATNDENLIKLSIIGSDKDWNSFKWGFHFSEFVRKKSDFYLLNHMLWKTEI